MQRFYELSNLRGANLKNNEHKISFMCHEKEKKSFDKNYKINPFYLTMRTRIQPLLFNRS